MTEERIIELLCKKYSNKTLTSQYKYELDTIENVSKTISELIYKNITSELSSNVERRKNLIVMNLKYVFNTLIISFSPICRCFYDLI